MLSCLSAAVAADLVNLRCEYRDNPLGIDAAKPRLSWVTEARGQKAEVRGQKQTAYQILVASTPELLVKDKGDLWDSGKVVSDQSIQVEYGGKPLESRLVCYWKVRVWLAAPKFPSEGGDKDGKATAWSQPAWWSMGLLKPDDWQAKWIKPDPWIFGTRGLDRCVWIWFPHPGATAQMPTTTAYFRAHLNLPADVGVRRASVMMCADNDFVLFVNGKEVLKGASWNSPEKADLTALLKAGDNVFAVAAGNGGDKPNPAGLLGCVTVELADGRQLTLETGPAWKTQSSEQTGWREDGFDDASWAEAREMAKFGGAPWEHLKEQLASMENSPAPWMRKEFNLTEAPARSLAFVNVKGYYELYVNGQKVSDDVLAPAVSQDKKRSLYTTYDITKLLRAGSNCVGLWLGRGWAKTGAIARVQLEMSVGGQRVVVGTDRTWTSMTSTHALRGPWEWNNMGGETIDARKEVAGWNEVGCKTGSWLPVEEIAAPDGVATAQSCPPNRINKVLPLVACTAKGANNWELDFGSNLTGWLRLRLPQLAAGQRLTISYADKPGQTFQQADEYISAGKPGEVFCSKFNYHGFRYATVDGLAVKPVPGDAEALLIESDLEPVGTFECSNDLFNRIHQLNLWTVRCLSLGGYMVDCPHRERLGYGDGQTSIEAQIMNRNAAAFYAKWAVDWLDAQDPATGRFPYTAPFVINSWGGPGWGGIGTVLPWKNYLYYGDRRLLEHTFEAMCDYSEFLDSQARDGLLRGTGDPAGFLGDWVPPERGMDTQNWPGKTACEIFNNGYRVYLWQILERSARALGKTKEADDFVARIDKTRKLIHTTYYDAQKEFYGLDEQAYQVLPLMTGVVPDALVGTVQSKLAEIILVKNKGHLDTGMLGTYFLIRYLQEAGRNDLLYTIFNQETYPGWGYMLAQGATTLWEQWNGYYSQIHSCFASPGGWFYQGLAGIRPDETGPGFKKTIIKPAVVGDLTWVKCSYDSLHGRIASSWKREAGKLTMEVTIPANTTATVYVPAKDAAGVTESGKPIAKAVGVTFLKMENNAAVYAVASGTYRFQSTLP
jgi:alpha-L-rhamnosidase